MTDTDERTDEVEPADDRRTDDHADGAQPTPGTGRELGEAGGRSTAVNGLLGGLVALFLLSIVPFAPLFGGLLAGYLESRDLEEGAVAGAYAGGFAAAVTVPGLLVFGRSVTGFVGFYAAGGLIELLVLVGLLYFAGLAAVGGAMGAFLNDEIGDDLGRY